MGKVPVLPASSSGRQKASACCGLDARLLSRSWPGEEKGSTGIRASVSESDRPCACQSFFSGSELSFCVDPLSLSSQ